MLLFYNLNGPLWLKRAPESSHSNPKATTLFTKLLGYHYDIHFKSRKTNTIVDTLS